MENIVSVTENPLTAYTIEIISEDGELDDIFDYYNGIESFFGDTTPFGITPQAYELKYEDDNKDSPSYMETFLKPAVLKKIFFKAGISNISKDGDKCIRHRIYCKLKDLISQSNTIKEYYNSKVLKEYHVKEALKLQGHYIYFQN